jgi:hypothetical protein
MAMATALEVAAAMEIVRLPMLATAAWVAMLS